MPDEPNLSHLPDDDTLHDQIDRTTLGTGDEEAFGPSKRDDDVPFHLPHVSELDQEPVDPRKDEHKMLTMPVFREPGVPDPKMTLPGSGGLDPNPDFAPYPPGAEQTMRHQAVQFPQPAAGSTIPNPQTAEPDHQRYQRPPGSKPAYMPPPQKQQQAPARPALPGRRRKRGLFGRIGCMWIFVGLLVTFCGGLTLVTAGAAVIVVPRIEQQWTARVAAVDDYRSFESTFIYDRHGNLLYEVFGEGRRETVDYLRMPQNLVNATIAIEDDTFFNNMGIDLGATTVAFLNYLGAGQDEQTAGGSTITQQLVRNVLFPFEKRAERSVQRKVEEIILAIVLTQYKSKEEILSLYLNEIYYGNLSYGAQAAAQTFFSKDVQNLTLGEAALLAGLPQAPADLDPLNPDPLVQEAVYNRWRQVLDEMVEEEYITAAQRDQTLAQGLNFSTPEISLKAPHFTVYAQSELERLMVDLGYTPEEIARGGLKVYTTIDQNINTLAQNTARSQVANLQKNNVSNAAVVVLKPVTGEILGMVGSIDYNNDAIDGRVNVTTSLRQPGSTMKIFTYSAALELGMTPGDVIWDTRTEIGIPGQEMYRPRNYDGQFHGPMRMRHALANSYNIPAVQTLRRVGVENFLNFLRRLGISTLSQDASVYGLSLTLGGGEVSLLELTGGYAVYPNQGSYVQPTSILCIVNNQGEILYQYENSCPNGRITAETVDRSALGTQVLDPRIAFLMTDILGDNNARSAAMGTNSALRTDGILTSVKTGTTNDVKDNWTVGYTRNLAIGVWVGNNNGDPMVNSSGLTGAAPIWNAVMTTIYNDPTMLASAAVGGQLLSDQPVPPPGMSVRSICDVRRLKDPAESCPASANEWFLDGPAGIPDADGNLYYPPQQAEQSGPPASGSYLQPLGGGVYRTVVFPLAPEVAAGIQFRLGPGEKTPPPPRYCRVPVELISIAAGAREQVFIAGPATSQTDVVEAEIYAQANGFAFLPTIDCWPEAFSAPVIGSGGGQIFNTAITSPVNGQLVTDNMPIVGTAEFSADKVRVYQIDILGGPFSNWTPLGEQHGSPVVNGQLEYLYAAGLPSGTYQLRLLLIDHNSNIYQTPYTVSFTRP